MEYISVLKWKELYPDLKNDTICSLCLDYIWQDKSFMYKKEDGFYIFFQDTQPACDNAQTRYCIDEYEEK